MSSDHFIGQFTTEVCFGHPDHALALQDRLPGFVHNRLAQVVGQVLDRACPPRERVRLKRLVVELGPINPASFEQDITEQLREALFAALDREISSRAHSSFDEMAGALFSIILSGSRQDIEPYWIPLLAAYGRRTRRLFRQKGASPLVRKHIAQIFPSERIKELVRLFEPIDHGFIIYFLDRPETLMARDVIRAEPHGSFKGQVTEFILAYLLVEQGSRFNKKIFLATVIHQISSHYNIRYQSLLASLIELFRSLKGESPLQKEILGFLLALGPRDNPDKELLTGPGRKAAALERFAHSSRGPEPGQIRSLRQLMASDPESIARFLSRRRTDPEVIQRFSSALAEADLLRLVDLIHPGKSRYLLNYTRVLGQNRYARLFAGSAKLGRSIVWEAVLAFEPPFEERAFCQKVIRQLARTYSGGKQRFFNRLIIRLVLDSRKNRAHYDLLRAVLELKGIRSGLELLQEKGVENLDNALAFFRHYLSSRTNRVRMAARFSPERLTALIHLVAPFDSEFIRGALDSAGAYVKQVPGQSQTQEDFQSMIYAYTLGVLSPELSTGFHPKNFLAGMIRRLACHTGRSYEKELESFTVHMESQKGKNPVTARMAILLQEIRSDRMKDRRLCSRKENARAMVMLFLTRILPEKGNETSYLLNAIKKFEKAAKDREAFYEAVLEKLILKKTIDFETLLIPLPPESRIKARRGEGKTGLVRKIVTLMTMNPLLLREFVQTHLSRNGFIKLLVSSLSSVQLHRLLYLMCPRDYPSVRGMADLLEKRVSNGFGISPGEGLEHMVWQGIFSGLLRSGKGHCVDMAAYTQGLARTLSDLLSAAGHKNVYSGIQKSLLRYEAKPFQNNHLELLNRVLSVLSKSPATLADPITGIQKRAEPKPDKKPSLPDPLVPPVETLYPDNAGLVLAAPYLPGLFRELGLLEKKGFADTNAALRGVRLLEHLADPDQHSPLARLVLNRILCGVDPPLPDEPEFLITDQERATCRSLIKGMIQNWKIIGNTSVQGFRESFLRRRAVLTLEPDGCWHLKVAPKSFDMLLDSIPWQFSTIKLPWMTRLLYVKWR